MNFICNKRFFYFILLLLNFKSSQSQVVEKIYKPYIRTAQLFSYGNQQGLPVYGLNSSNRLELEFDDMDANYKNYYYTFVLCDYNWNPSNLTSFDYLKGFTQNRITTYRYSNIAYTNYTHYQAMLPSKIACQRDREIIC